MTRAYIDTTPQGYVVKVAITSPVDIIEVKALRNFGDYKSAAIEFRDFINHGFAGTPAELERHINGWAKTYNPADLYTYPVIDQMKTNVTLRKQKK